eukprot:2882828-Prymnesium_polylepis.1
MCSSPAATSPASMLASATPGSSACGALVPPRSGASSSGRRCLLISPLHQRQLRLCKIMDSQLSNH